MHLRMLAASRAWEMLLVGCAVDLDEGTIWPADAEVAGVVAPPPLPGGAGLEQELRPVRMCIPPSGISTRLDCTSTVAWNAVRSDRSAARAIA
jgi:hypothetical protein